MREQGVSGYSREESRASRATAGERAEHPGLWQVGEQGIPSYDR